MRARKASNANASAARTATGSNLCQGPRRLGDRIGNNWCAVVVTVMVVLLPGATEAGFAAQVVAAAVSEQLTLTLPEVPRTATVYVAGFPELTVALVGEAGVRVKSVMVSVGGFGLWSGPPPG